MSGLQAAYAAPLGLSVLACAVVLVLVWRRRHASSAVRAFAHSVVGQVLWGLGYLGELWAPTLQGKQLWDMLQILPADLVACEGLRFALLYTGSSLLQSRASLLALWALPIAHLAVVFTSPLHGAAYYDAHLRPAAPFDALVYSFTPLDQLLYAYLALLLLSTGVVLIRAVLRQDKAYRAQLVPVAFALLLPSVSSVLLVSGVHVLGQRDSAPYAFAISSVIITFTLLRRRLFDLHPIAYEAVVAATPEAVLVVDEAERVVDANPALRRLLDNPDKLIGEPLALAVPWAKPVLGAEPWRPVDIALSPERIVEGRSAPLTNPQGQAVGRVLTFQDVTLTRRAAQLLLDASRQQLRDVLDQAFQLMGVLELDGKVSHANRTALDLVGAKLDDVVGKPFWETPWWAHSADDRQTLQSAIQRAANGQLVRFSTSHRDARGEHHHIDFSIKPVLDTSGAVSVLVAEGRNVTELRRADEQKRALEQQLAQAQKLESLGRLAGGVAHDFNNLLTAILGNVELARLDLPSDAAVRQNLNDIAHASESAKALVQQLLVFGRQPTQEDSVVDLRDSVETTLRMLARLLGENVAIVTQLPSAPCYVRIGARQLEQLLVNLAVNARDAMPDGGQLRIGIEQLGEPGAARARLSVSDSGCGMSKEVLARIFEPFFTTKPVGKGTGLGLALAFAVVRQAGGEIRVESALGKGSTFSVELPMTQASPGAPRPRLENTLPGGRETILLVEDQQELSRLAQRTLRRLGYTVHAYGNGEELLQSLAQVPRADLLLSDVVLPGISGPALADRLSEAQPWLRVLFASGYHEESLSRHTRGLAANRVLTKPFSLEELARAVRQTLEEPAA